MLLALVVNHLGDEVRIDSEFVESFNAVGKQFVFFEDVEASQCVIRLEDMEEIDEYFEDQEVEG